MSFIISHYCIFADELYDSSVDKNRKRKNSRRILNPTKQNDNHFDEKQNDSDDSDDSTDV